MGLKLMQSRSATLGCIPDRPSMDHPMQWPQQFRVRLQQWWHHYIFQEVPAADSACEFECRRLSCSQGEWETCEFRRQHMPSQPFSADTDNAAEDT